MRKPTLSICLCVYNGLPYTQLLFDSIGKHTVVDHEICVHDNGSTDGTLKWLSEQDCKVSRSEKNLGWTGGTNRAVEISSGKYIYNFNNDMYALPGYDTKVVELIIEKRRANKTMVSPGIIEPIPCYPPQVNPIRFDAGTSWDNFDEAKLLNFWDNLNKGGPNIIDFMQPTCLSRKLWDKIGGLNEVYFPGWGADWQQAYDIHMAGGKMIQCGGARVYHFNNKTLCTTEKAADRCDKGIALFHELTGLGINTDKLDKLIGRTNVVE